MIERIADLVKEGSLDGISDLRDESDRRGMRVVIELKKDANSQVILNKLFHRTQMQQTFGVNMVTLVENRPRTVTLRELMQPIYLVPETMPAHQLLEVFLRERKHLAAVLDEYGGFEGVVTLEDVLECLLGKEILDEEDEGENMQQLALRRSRFAPHEGKRCPKEAEEGT